METDLNAQTDTQRVTVLERLVEHLSHEVGRLQKEFSDLRADLATEVRTQRLAVVHPIDGRELIYTHTAADGIALQAQWHPDQCFATVEVVDNGRAAITVGGTTQDVVGLVAHETTDQYGNHQTDGHVRITPAKWTGTPGDDYQETNPAEVEISGKGLTIDAGTLRLRATLAVDS